MSRSWVEMGVRSRGVAIETTWTVEFEYGGRAVPVETAAGIVGYLVAPGTPRSRAIHRHWYPWSRTCGAVRSGRCSGGVQVVVRSGRSPSTSALSQTLPFRFAIQHGARACVGVRCGVHKSKCEGGETVRSNQSAYRAPRPASVCRMRSRILWTWHECWVCETASREVRTLRHGKEAGAPPRRTTQGCRDVGVRVSWWAVVNVPFLTSMLRGLGETDPHTVRTPLPLSRSRPHDHTARLAKVVSSQRTP